MTYELFPIGPAQRTHRDAEFEQFRQHSAKLADGGAIVVWFDTRDTADMGTFSDNAVMARRYDSDGRPVGGERLIAEVDNYLRPVVTGLEGGGYAIGWRDGEDARFAVFDARNQLVADNSLGTPAHVRTVGDRTVTAPASAFMSTGGPLEWDLTSLDTGGFAFTWQARSERTSVMSAADNSFTQTFDAAGNALGPPVALGPWAGVGGGSHAVTTTGGAMLEGGQYALLISLPPGETERSQTSVAVRVFNEDGTPAGDPVLLDPDTPGMQYPRDIVTLADGRPAALWYTSAWERDGGGLKVVRLDADGTPPGEGMRIEGGSSSSAWVTAMADGGWLVAWYMPVTGGHPGTLRAQRYDPEGNPVGTFTEVANVRSGADRGEYGFTGFYGPGDFLALDAGPLLGVFTGNVNERDGEALPRADFDVFVRPYMPDLVGTAGNDRLEAHDIGTVLHGLQGNDVLIVGPGDDLLLGGPGHDTLRGGPGNDTLDGGPGHDLLIGGAGHDLLIGGGGNDTLRGGPGNDTLRGGPGDDVLLGQRGNDLLVGGAGDDLLRGGPGNDTLRGGPGNDTLDGGPGNDVLRGGAGRDLLRGGPGDDLLHGGAGRDTLIGGPGDDTMIGGRGADTFVFARGHDRATIRDFTPDEGDVLQLRSGLWAQDLTPQQVVNRFAEVTEAGHTVLAFRTGDTVVLRGFDDLDTLVDHIEIA